VESTRPWAQALLRQAGLSVTRPRLLVLAALRDRRRPVTAQDLHRELKAAVRGPAGPDARGETPGLTTVYRTLSALAGRGVLHCFHDGGAETAYRLCPPQHHHHLICRCCGQVQEQCPGAIRELVAELADAQGFAVEDYYAELVGLCAVCRPDAAMPRSTGRGHLSRA
jgi:Fur family ferric uptake transcriptional regulator